MVPIVSIVGNSGTGKTTLLEKLVKELKLRGYRLAVIKHCPHGFDMGQPGKDSWRLTTAGSDITVVSSPERIARIERVNQEVPLEQIAVLLADRVDVVLAEGYKNGNTDKVLVLGTDHGEKQFRHDQKILATVPVRLSSLGVLEFDYEDVTHVVNLIIGQIGENSPRRFEDVLKANDLAPACGVYQTSKFEELLAESAVLHGHICPGQVLGIRMAIRGCQELGIEKPREEKERLVVYVEIDRCATDAIQVVTGCKLGKRTMKYIDLGKVAATFVDLGTGDALRLVAREDARQKAILHSGQGQTRHEAGVAAYKALSDEELFHIQRVRIQVPVEDRPGPPLHRVICDECGEGINDYREVMAAGRVLCRSCAYGRYYQLLRTTD